ncbi:HAD-IA family hydrolase [Brachybacterium sp. DNPG3]
MRTVIWDLGGTLVDGYPDVDRALADASGAPIEEVAALTRISSGHAITVLAARADLETEVLRRAYDDVKETWRRVPPPAMDGAVEALAAVRAGGGLNLVATHRDRRSAEQLLGALGLQVDDMVCAPDGFARKPDPAMTLALLERHELDPARCLAVGDRPADVEAAEAAGVRALLLVTPGIALEAPGTERIGSLRDLLGPRGLLTSGR